MSALGSRSKPRIASFAVLLRRWYLDRLLFTNSAQSSYKRDVTACDLYAGIYFYQAMIGGYVFNTAFSMIPD